MLESLRFRFRRGVVARTLWAAARLRLPALAASILSRYVLPVHPGRAPAAGAHSIRVLMLPKIGFDEDMTSAFGERPDYHLMWLDRSLLKAVYWAFLPRWVDDNNYISDSPRIEAQKGRLREFWRTVLERMRLARRVDVVMTGNFCYPAEQEFAGALTELGIPMLALHKECLKTPGLEPFFTDVYRERRSPFQGSKICVYNEIEAGIQLSSGMASEADIVVTGMPRLDRVHRMRTGANGRGEAAEQEDGVRRDNGHGAAARTARPTVLFLSFPDKVGLPIIRRKIERGLEELSPELESMAWTELARSCHAAVVELARAHPDIDVVIKTKGDYLAQWSLDAHLGPGVERPPNLQVVFGGDVLALIAQASVVCGFNSTALLEALAMNKRIVVPCFAEATHPDYAPFVLDLEGSVDWAASPEDLVARLVENARLAVTEAPRDELSEAQKHALERWVGNCDGRAGERVERVVRELVQGAAAH